MKNQVMLYRFAVMQARMKGVDKCPAGGGRGWTENPYFSLI
jgi:hypothetical protein